MTNIWEIKDQFRSGMFDQALKNIKNLPKSQIIFGEILRAEILERQGRLEHALDVINTVYEKINPENVILQFLAEVMRAGIVYKLGDYGVTKKCLMNASSVYLKLPNKEEVEIIEVIANFKRIQGNYYLSQGTLDPAITSFQESLQIFQKLDLQGDIAMIFHDLGQIQEFKGNNDSAIGHFESAFLIQQKMDHKSNMAICLNKLIITNLKLNQLIKSEKHLQQLKILSQQVEDDFVPLLYKFSKAMIYKHSTRLAVKFRSQRLFKEISDDKIIDHNLTMLAMLNYGDLLLEELKLMFDNNMIEEVSTDLLNISKRISHIAYSLDSIPLIIETLIMQSRFAAINGNLHMALDILEQAKDTARSKNLEYFLKRISDCVEQVNKEYYHWFQLFSAKNQPYYELEIMDVSNYLDNVKRILDVDKN